MRKLRIDRKAHTRKVRPGKYVKVKRCKYTARDMGKKGRVGKKR